MGHNPLDEEDDEDDEEDVSGEVDTNGLIPTSDLANLGEQTGDKSGDRPTEGSVRQHVCRVSYRVYPLFQTKEHVSL